MAYFSPQRIICLKSLIFLAKHIHLSEGIEMIFLLEVYPVLFLDQSVSQPASQPASLARAGRRAEPGGLAAMC